LCEEGYRYLLEVACEIPIQIEMVDISHSHNHELKKIYGRRIPVVVSDHTRDELDWPFTPEDVKAFLAS
jgi:hypothetical protein